MTKTTATPAAPEEPLPVRIARDVIQRLDVGELKLRSGVYLTVREGFAGIAGLFTGSGSPAYKADLTADLQPHVDALERGCKACLLGACFLSKIRLDDKVTAGRIVSNGLLDADGGDVRETLREAGFSPASLSLLECCFERSFAFTSGLRGDDYVEQGREAADYLRGKFRYKRDLVRAVMENVIANGGEFVPGPLAKARLERETAAGTPTPGPEASS